MRKVLYIGEFPPPFGGVTTKNQFIKDCIFDNDANKVEWINLYDYKKQPLKLAFLLKSLIVAKHEQKAICIGVGKKSRVETILSAIKFIGGSDMLSHTYIFVMASTLYEYCKENEHMLNLIKSCKCLYIELQSMINEINTLGVTNTGLLPNCREGNKACKPHKIHKKKIKLVFFSMVRREKGVPYLFEMAERLNNTNVPFELDIYGEINKDYKAEFGCSLQKSVGVNYKGVFDIRKDDLYGKLNEYDLLLLPTEWKGESCVGILVESKMAGIPAIVSNHKYNSEIVLNNIEGIVVDGNLASGFANAVEQFANNSTFYDEIAENAFKSRKRYEFETYKKMVRNEIYGNEPDSN